MIDTKSEPARRTLTIGLLWHSPNSANLGVGALTLGNIAILRRAAAAAGVIPHFLIIGFVDPGKPFYVAGDDIEIAPLNAKAFAPRGALWKAIARCDCVFDIGGGDSFTDIYGKKRFAYLWLSKFAVLVHQVPLILSPQTIGPFDRQPQRLLAAWIMKRARCVLARDPASFSAAQAMAPRANLAQATDVAFALPFTRIEQPAGLFHVGINVSGLLFNGGYSGKNEFGMSVDYATFSRKLIAALSSRPATQVHLISHVNSDAVPQDDDGRVAQILALEFPNVVLPAAFADPVAAKSYIAGLDLVVGGRMHACIAAHSSEVPVVPVAYSRKFAGLFDGVLNYPYFVPVSGMDTDQAVSFVLDAVDKTVEMRAAIHRSQDKVAALLADYSVAATSQMKLAAAR